MHTTLSPTRTPLFYLLPSHLEEEAGMRPLCQIHSSTCLRSKMAQESECGLWS